MELGTLASSSLSSGLGTDLQRGVIAHRVFGAAPRTIGRFEILEVVGAGAGGVVYAGRDPLLDRRVAIKLLARPSGNPPDPERWLREARALAQLSHRNVVTIYEVGEWSGRSFLAMELIDGCTLARWLAEPRTLAEISAVFADAGLGLAAAHACHRVHRDFKPANVLVAQDGRVVVTDFGLVDDPAGDGGHAAGQHPPVGTPAYAAPEQRRGAVPAPSADVYSFAVALTEAVLGDHPRPDESTRWRPRLRRRVSRRLYRELCAAMALDPRQRTPSLAPLLAALPSARRHRSHHRQSRVAVTVAVAVALGVGAWTGERGAARRLHEMPVREGPAGLFDAAAELRATAVERRDERWAERARALLLQPVPMRVSCAWPEPAVRVDFEVDAAVMQDLKGRRLRCEIRTGRLAFAGSAPRVVASPRPDRAPPERVLAPGGDRALQWTPGGRLDLYDLASGRRYPLAEARIQAAAFLRGEDVVAADDRGTVWRWSIPQLRSWVLADHTAKATMWAFTACEPGGEIVSATAHRDDAILVSSPSGAPQRTLVKPAGAEIFSLSCRGDEIVAGTGDGRVLQWRSQTGSAPDEHELGVDSWVWAIAPVERPGGPRVTFLGSRQLRGPSQGGRVLALQGGAPRSVYAAHPGGNTGIDELAVSSDGGRVAVATSSGELALIDVAGERRVAAVPAHQGEAHRVRFTDADRSLVTVGDDGDVRRWRADDLAIQRQIDIGHGQIFDLDVRGSIALVATSNGHVGAWELNGGRNLRSYAGHRTAVVTARFDRSSAWLADGDVAGVVCVHRANRERCHVELRGHEPGFAVRHVRFLSDGQLITGSDDGTVRQWNLPGDASTAALAAELEARSGGAP